MRMLSWAALPLLLAGVAVAQPINENPPTRTIQCLDVDGSYIPAFCDAPASRLDKREYICTCPAGGMRTEVSICAQGERVPPENRALRQARRLGMRDGTLVGDTVKGQKICVAPRHSQG